MHALQERIVSKLKEFTKQRILIMDRLYITCKPGIFQFDIE